MDLAAFSPAVPVMQIQTRKACHLSSEGLGIFWPQYQTWHTADFWMSQCGHCRPRPRYLQYLERGSSEVNGCELLFPLEFPALLKLLPPTEASCHLSSEQLGSISEPLWASSSMPATHLGQKDILWHDTLSPSCQPTQYTTDERWKRNVFSSCAGPLLAVQSSHTPVNLPCSSSTAVKWEQHLSASDSWDTSPPLALGLPGNTICGVCSWVHQQLGSYGE